MHYLKKHSKKRYFVSFLLLLLFIVGGGAYFFFHAGGVKAEWFDSSWFYRQAVTVTVTSSASDVSNLDTWFSMNTSALIGATPSKMQTSCQDLRFTNANGKLLPYYIDSGCNTTTTKIWVKIDLVPKNSTTYTLYAYYGNPNAVAATDATKFNLYNGLVGYWRMNESAGAGSTLADASVNGNTGTASLWGGGNISTDSAHVAGKYGNAFSFDGGDDYVNAGSGSSLNLTGAMTVSVWIKAGRLWNSANGYYNNILGKIDTSNADGYRLRIYERGIDSLNYLEFVTKSGGTSYGGSNTYVVPNNFASDWTQVVGTVDASGNIKVYVNGVLVASPTPAGFAGNNPTSSLWIGYENSGLSTVHPFPGLLDDARIYNRALSASEVAQSYADGTSSILTAVAGQSVPSVSFAEEEKGPAPVAYWKFDEGQGQTAYDDSSNNNDATLGSTSEVDANDPTWQTSSMCVTGKCLKFDGSTSYVNAGNGTSLQADTVTVEAWVKLTAAEIASSGSIRGVVTKTSGNSYANFEWGIVHRYSSGEKAQLYLYGTDAGVKANTGYVIDADTWYHIVAIIKQVGANQTGEIFVNGVSKDTDTAAATWETAQSVYIGSCKTSGYSNGFIDDVKIYPYARTAAQILTDYNSRKSTAGASAQIGGQSAWMTNGLVGYWKMDEASGAGSTLADSSGNGNTGTAVLWGGGNTATDSAHVAGKFGNAFSFDGGDDYVNAGSNSSLAITSGSIEAWVKADSLTHTGGGSYSRIIDKSTGSAGAGGYGLAVLNTGTLTFYVAGVSGGIISQANAITVGSWYHIVADWDSNQSHLYINGVLKKTDSGSAGATSTANMFIGASEGVAGRYWQGSIDEVRIYNRVLSPKEVADLYNWAPGPVGYWKMDDKVSGNLQTLVDSSTYSNTGTTYNGANATGMNCKIIGKYGGGCLFDGVDDYVAIADDNSLDNIRTFEIWVNPLDQQDSTYARILITKAGDNIRNGLTLNYALPNSFFLYYRDSAGTDSSVSYAIPVFNTWYHVVGILNSDLKAELYVNGVSRGTGIALIDNKGAVMLTSNIKIGGGAVNRYADVLIDDVRIYNYARSAKQIMEDMRAGNPSAGSGSVGPAAYYRFDEGHDTTVYDNSVNANTGTITNGASWNNSGKFGKALSFDGTSNYVSIASNPTSLQITNDLSISSWINLTTNNAVHDIVAKKGASGQFGYRLSTTTGGKLQFEISSSGANTRAATGSATLANNVWYHVTGAYSPGNSITVYVNGNQDGQVTTSLPSSIYNSTSNVNIGAENAGASNFFAGSIDEVKIYPFALTASDVQTEYNQGKAIAMGSLSDTSGLTGGSIASNSASAAYCIPGDTATCNPPVAEWNFNEKVSGNLQTVYDTSGNGNNGTTYYGANLTGMNCKVIGKYGGGCLFDGVDDYVDAGDKLDAGASDFSVEAWIKGSVTAKAIISKIDVLSAGTDGWYVGIGAGGYLYAYFDDDISGSATNADGRLINDNIWHHVVVVFDRDGNMTRYVDGTTTGTVTSISSLTSDQDNVNKLMIGARDYVDNPSYFSGLIDEVKIFNYARTPAQIAWDYNRGKPVGYWKLDECQGLTAYDSSGNGNTGTITIGATIPQTTAGTCAESNSAAAWYNGLSGKMNSALSFDGVDDYVKKSTANWQSTDSAGTILLWFKTGSTGHSLFSSSDELSASRYLQFLITSNALGVWQRNDDTADLVIGTTSVVNNQWHFGALVSDGTAYSIYLDGALESLTVSTGANTGDWFADTSNRDNFSIGVKYDNDPDYYMSGLIDEVKIFNYALTPAQIKMDYNQGSAVRFGPTTGRP